MWGCSLGAPSATGAPPPPRSGHLPSTLQVIVPNLLGNGVSASPSTLAAQAESGTPRHAAAWAPDGHPPPPRFSVSDNVRAQRSLLQSLGIIEASPDNAPHAPGGGTNSRGPAPLALVYGYSMGALQAFEWAVAHPHEVARVAAVCGASRCGELNSVFLRSLEATLKVRGARGRMGKQPGRLLAARSPPLNLFARSKSLPPCRIEATPPLPPLTSLLLPSLPLAHPHTSRAQPHPPILTGRCCMEPPHLSLLPPPRPRPRGLRRNLRRLGRRRRLVSKSGLRVGRFRLGG